MRSAVGALGLTARIGVNTGEVVTGAGDTLVTGDAVNVAARPEQHAPPGEVLIGRETRRLVRGAVETEPVQLDVRGKATPVDAHRLLAVDLHAPAVVRRLNTPLVGRARALEVLHQAYERAVTERACHLFTLLGSAGVGKSRLVSELLNGIDADVVSGRCLDYGEGITYWPVVEVLKQLGPRAEPTLDLLTHGAVSTGELFWAVRARLEEAARERPLVVVFDDIHWGEPTFLDLLDHIADLSREAPILLLCVARAELIDARPGWGGGKLNATTAAPRCVPAVDRHVG
jgi:AAA ATPase domain/Adenylate and Guanylate cyclase catalytic domain